MKNKLLVTLAALTAGSASAWSGLGVYNDSKQAVKVEINVSSASTCSNYNGVFAPGAFDNYDTNSDMWIGACYISEVAVTSLGSPDGKIKGGKRMVIPVKPIANFDGYIDNMNFRVEIQDNPNDKTFGLIGILKAGYAR